MEDPGVIPPSFPFTLRFWRVLMVLGVVASPGSTSAGTTAPNKLCTVPPASSTKTKSLKVANTETIQLHKSSPKHSYNSSPVIPAAGPNIGLQTNGSGCVNPATTILPAPFQRLISGAHVYLRKSVLTRMICFCLRSNGRMRDFPLHYWDNWRRMRRFIWKGKSCLIQLRRGRMRDRLS